MQELLDVFEAAAAAAGESRIPVWMSSEAGGHYPLHLVITSLPFYRGVASFARCCCTNPSIHRLAVEVVLEVFEG